ncbi:coiled-coil domain-containing protein 121-like [Saccopteryx leptura]|uniref:coiled-coil domain-containing protein 121-like n=1 Tax=Saccopteryx leptura TaxID=249018 RepID=UPI00339C9371
MGLIKKTVEVMKLDHELKETQIQQKVVREEAELLLNEQLPVQAEIKVTLANLVDTTKESRREIERQWDSYAQAGAETLQRGQESASKSARQPSEPRATQLLAKEKLDSDPKQQSEAARDSSPVKEDTDYRELQTVQEALRRARAQTAAKAHARFLQAKASLEQQLCEPAASGTLGKREEKLRRRVQALEVAAEKCASQLRRLGAEGQDLQDQDLHDAVVQQLRQRREGTTLHSWLKLQKQDLQQHQYSTKCLLPERRDPENSHESPALSQVQSVQQGFPAQRLLFKGVWPY